MNSTITVTTGARLHFGPLSYRPDAGRHFGGVGVMIDEPGFRISLQCAAQDCVSGDESVSQRVRQFLGRYREACPTESLPPPCEINVQEAMPSHRGLGSGTQLGLAVARGLAMLTGDEDLPVTELARRVGRGRRSAVGIHGFERGGLIVDAGQQAADDIGTLACRVAMPKEWQVLLITPREGNVGLSGQREDDAFDRLGSMPQSLTDRLCRIVLTEMLPAVEGEDLPRFGAALYDYGRLVGEFFSPVQGGTFGHPQADTLIDELSRLGIAGTGQTSWGPTVFAFVPNDEIGRQVSAALSQKTSIDLQRSGLRSCGAGTEKSTPLSQC